MKTVKLYEYKDLDKETKEKVLNKEINEIVELDLEFFTEELNKNNITEEKYYNILGCSKSYAESTNWFVPSCYYDKHKEDIEKEAKETIKVCLFTKEGRFVQLVEK